MARYETTDIFKGAFLLCKGGALSGITFNERRIATFAISGNEQDMRQLEHDYMTGKALVNPVLLRRSLNHLRDLLFDMRERRDTRDDRPARNRHHQKRR